MRDELEALADELMPGGRIAVYCDIAGRHSKRRPEALVAVFGAYEGSDPERWNVRGNISVPVQVQYSTEGTVGQIIGPRQLVRSREGAPDHLRYELRCIRCGMHTVQARAEVLYDALDWLQHAGISSVTLRGLAAIISSGSLKGES